MPNYMYCDHLNHYYNGKCALMITAFKLKSKPIN